jgi:hypothetical protein
VTMLVLQKLVRSLCMQRTVAKHPPLLKNTVLQQHAACNMQLAGMGLAQGREVHV